MTQGSAAPGVIGFLTIPALFSDLFERKSTGQLILTRDGTVKKVLLKNGSVIFATSNLDEDRLGDILLSRGMISRVHFEESSRIVRETGRKQGTVLVQIKALTPKDLFRGLIFQVREIVISLFSWYDGTHQFLEGLPPQEDMVSLRLSLAGLIFEGLARLAGEERFRAAWEPASLRLTAKATSPHVLDELDCPVAAKHLLALVSQGKPWGTMGSTIGTSEREAAALLYGLTLLGFVQATIIPANVAAAAPAAAPPAPPAAAAEEDAETLRLRERIASFAAKLPTLNLYQVFGLTPACDLDTLKRAYISLAKEFHPDRFFQPAFADLQEQVNTIFVRVNEAYSTLHTPQSRQEYDREVLHLVPTTRAQEEKPKDSRVAQEQFLKGLGQLNAGDLWSAIQSFRWAVNLNPQNPRYHTYLGVALTKTKKRLHEAEEHCKTAIALDYNNAQYYVHLGQVYKTGHLYEKARKQFETALRLDPKHPQALKELGDLAKQTGEPERHDKSRNK